MKLTQVVLFYLLMNSFSLKSQQNYNAQIEYNYKHDNESLQRHTSKVELYNLFKSGVFPDDSLSTELIGEFDYFENFGTDYYQILNGCSWYCGASYEVECSSELPEQGIRKYGCNNISNFSFKDAWIENVEGNGSGESIEFYFRKDHPRLTHVFVANGYVRTELLYKNHSRVKVFKVFLNNIEIATLKLQDVFSLQSIILDEPIIFSEDNNILRFVIAETYSGEKYQETAISEIYFDGLDVH